MVLKLGPKRDHVLHRWDQEYQVDRTDPVLPGVLVNGTTGLIPSPVCSGEQDDGASPVYLVIPGHVYVVHGPVTALELSIGWREEMEEIVS